MISKKMRGDTPFQVVAALEANMFPIIYWGSLYSSLLNRAGSSGERSVPMEFFRVISPF